ncbi:unnamed protein product [Prorocentrum cordatum]|uniref:Uncharacterized protein n=1 Tax=Prorocentrum cordatum TaxID=2364126 RepID=A0ABN9WLN9_9DINO|nr:unnamed protein product [Polarella glacialis]
MPCPPGCVAAEGKRPPDPRSRWLGVGCARVTYRRSSAARVSHLAEAGADGGTRPWAAPGSWMCSPRGQSSSVDLFREGSSGAAELVRAAQGTNAVMTWLIRVLGVLFAVFGVRLSLYPVEALAQALDGTLSWFRSVPIAGPMLDFAGDVIRGAVGCAVSLIALGIAVPASLAVITVMQGGREIRVFLPGCLDLVGVDTVVRGISWPLLEDDVPEGRGAPALPQKQAPPEAFGATLAAGLISDLGLARPAPEAPPARKIPPANRKTCESKAPWAATAELGPAAVLELRGGGQQREEEDGDVSAEHCEETDDSLRPPGQAGAPATCPEAVLPSVRSRAAPSGSTAAGAAAAPSGSALATQGAGGAHTEHRAVLQQGGNHDPGPGVLDRASRMARAGQQRPTSMGMPTVVHGATRAHRHTLARRPHLHCHQVSAGAARHAEARAAVEARRAGGGLLRDVTIWWRACAPLCPEVVSYTCRTPMGPERSANPLHIIHAIERLPFYLQGLSVSSGFGRAVSSIQRRASKKSSSVRAFRARKEWGVPRLSFRCRGTRTFRN